jgi:hypothetical protein
VRATIYHLVPTVQPTQRARRALVRRSSPARARDRAARRLPPALPWLRRELPPSPRVHASAQSFYKMTKRHTCAMLSHFTKWWAASQTVATRKHESVKNGWHDLENGWQNYKMIGCSKMTKFTCSRMTEFTKITEHPRKMAKFTIAKLADKITKWLSIIENLWSEHHSKKWLGSV